MKKLIIHLQNESLEFSMLEKYYKAYGENHASQNSSRKDIYLAYTMSGSKVGFSNISNECNTVSPCAGVIEAQLRLSHGRILIYYMYSLSKNFLKNFYGLC